MSIEQQGPKLLHTGPNTWQGVTNAGVDANQIYLALQGIDGYIPYVGSNYILVDAVGTDADENGAALVAALADVKALTPNGQPLSNENRGVLFLFPGTYNVAAKITLGECVDIIGIGNPYDIFITSDDTSTIEIQSPHDYILQNITITNTNGVAISTAGPNDTGTWDNIILYGSTPLDITYEGIYKNILCISDFVLAGSISGTVSNCQFQNYSCGASNTAAVTLSSTSLISDCTGLTGCFGYSNGSGSLNMSGTINNCRAQNTSFGYTTGSINLNVGSIISNCQATDPESFCFCVGDIVRIYGSITNCLSGSDSFGVGSTGAWLYGSISGCSSSANDTEGGSRSYMCCETGSVFLETYSSITNCNAGTRAEMSFGYADSIIMSGEAYIKNCISGNQSFLSGQTGVSITGNPCTISDCIGGDYCFLFSTNASVTNNGIINNCVGKDNCFISSDGTGSVQNDTGGTIINCTGGNNCFVSGLTTMSSLGSIINCKGLENCFGDTSATGRLTNCNRSNNFGRHAGIIDKCTFYDSTGAACITVVDGCVIRYCTLVSVGATYTIECTSGTATISFYHCSLYSGEDPATVTNNIATPYNVIDTNVII
jgi:hypothetical protein